jgi:hypothetical protein
MVRPFIPIATIVLVVACSSDDDAALATSNGVNDVKRACEIKLAWKNATSSACIDCLAAAANPPCACSEQRFASAGRCQSQQTQRSQATSCEGVEECRFKCPSTDCACIDRCYAQKEACRTAASALEGCVVEACEAQCGPS